MLTKNEIRNHKISNIDDIQKVSERYQLYNNELFKTTEQNTRNILKVHQIKQDERKVKMPS